MGNTRQTIEVRGDRNMVAAGLQYVRMLAARDTALDTRQVTALQALARRPVWCVQGAVLFIDHPEANALGQCFVSLAEKVGLSCTRHGAHTSTEKQVHLVIHGNGRDARFALSKHNSAEEALNQRESVWREHQQRTSPVVGVPADLARMMGFEDAVHQILTAAGQVEGPPRSVELYPMIAAGLDASAEAVAYLVVQEGGSSAERYLTGYDKLADAQAKRVSAWRDGAYPTSPIVQVPSALANHREFVAVLEEALFAAAQLSAGPEAIERHMRQVEAGSPATHQRACAPRP